MKNNKKIIYNKSNKKNNNKNMKDFKVLVQQQYVRAKLFLVIKNLNNF